MYSELRLPNPSVLADANLLGVINRLKRAFKGDLIDRDHIQLNNLINRLESKNQVEVDPNVKF